MPKRDKREYKKPKVVTEAYREESILACAKMLGQSAECDSARPPGMS